MELLKAHLWERTMSAREKAVELEHLKAHWLEDLKAHLWELTMSARESVQEKAVELEHLTEDS